jgi:transposase
MDRESRATWEKRIERWRDSGLSAKEYAAEVGINAGSLKWWAWRVGAAEKSQPPKVRARRRRSPKIASAVTSSPLTFVEMATTVTATDAIEIVLPSTVRVRVRRGFDDTTLRRVLDVLEQRR